MLTTRRLNLEDKQLFMFKSPFSFNGRIRRTEYGLSVIIYVVVILLLEGIIGATMESSSSTSKGVAGLIFLLLVIPLVIFLWAQGAKRCHDLGNSGWFQLIPLYPFWLLFADGEHGINEYGENPKGIGNEPGFSFEEQQNISGTRVN